MYSQQLLYHDLYRGKRCWPPLFTQYYTDAVLPLSIWHEIEHIKDITTKWSGCVELTPNYLQKLAKWIDLDLNEDSLSTYIKVMLIFVH